MKLRQGPWPESIELVESRTGCLRVVGAVIILWGALVCGTALGITGVMEDDEDMAVRLTVFAIGTLILSGGMGVFFLQSGLIIDRGAMTAVNWMGPHLRLAKKSIRISDYRSLRYYTTVDEFGSEDHRLDLSGADLLADHNLEIFLTRQEGRDLAQQVAQFLGYPLHIEDQVQQAAPEEEY